MTKKLIINFCNQCPYYFFDLSEYGEENLCMNMKLGDPDGRFLSSKNRTEEGFIIPEWCPLDEL